MKNDGIESVLGKGGFETRRGENKKIWGYTQKAGIHPRKSYDLFKPLKEEAEGKEKLPEVQEVTKHLTRKLVCVLPAGRDHLQKQAFIIILEGTLA